MKYRKKPVVIEAVQFNPDRYKNEWTDNGANVNNLAFGTHRLTGVRKDITSSTGFSIDTLEGKHEVSIGDWIITGVKGEKYPIKEDIFKLTYEKVEE